MIEKIEKIAVIGSHSFLGSHFIRYALSQGASVLGFHSGKTSIPFTPYHWKGGSARNLRLKKLNSKDHPDKVADMINDYQPDYSIYFEHENQNPFSKTTDPLNNSAALIKIHRHSANAPFFLAAPTLDIYGPGQEIHEPIPRIILSILLEKKFPLYGGGHAIKSFVHIDDFVTNIFKMASEGAPGKVYHFSADHSISIRDLVTLICKRLNVAFEDVVSIADVQSSKKMIPFLQHSKNQHQVDWQLTTELEEGINDVITWAEEWLPALKNYSTHCPFM